MKFQCCVAVCLALAICTGGASDDHEAIRLIGKRYEQVEAQLPRSVHYLQKSENDGVTDTDQAWLTEARDILKVSHESTAPGTRELREIFLTPDDSPMLVLDRREKTLSDGSTEISEKRTFFSGYNLTRLLTKNAVFPAGASLDTVKVKNVPGEIAKLPEHERDGSVYIQEAQRIVSSLFAAGPPEHDPGTGSPGDSARYRLIQRTTSPDGRLALGFGTTDNPVPWDTLSDTAAEVTGYPLYDSEGDNVRNYVVDLNSHRILGETGCAYIGTRHSYNHRAVFVSWSANDRFFLQTFDSKWSTDEARAGSIDLEHGKLATTDVIGPATTQAYKFLSARKDRAYRRYGADFAVRLSCEELLDDGTMKLDVTGEIPKSGDGESEFSVAERVRIKPGGARATLQFLETKKGEQ